MSDFRFLSVSLSVLSSLLILSHTSLSSWAHSFTWASEWESMQYFGLPCRSRLYYAVEVPRVMEWWDENWSGGMIIRTGGMIIILRDKVVIFL